jgi:hypothetical protein
LADGGNSFLLAALVGGLVMLARAARLTSAPRAQHYLDLLGRLRDAGAPSGVGGVAAIWGQVLQRWSNDSTARHKRTGAG